ncbi:MAG TPA: TIGR03557 family F420-dependent LLM class oxidoreductase [Acidimicrobiales bacterium]|nr:TIGR03557 family F420-dependent LLM class oxidoreductase [Acidimicrobiales bacterium]
MARIGYFLSSEEHGPNFLVSSARQAEEAGFEAVFISDHYHPWIDKQGESPFVWSVIGGIASTTRLRLTTGVTCPTIRIHPAIVAQAAATAQLMLNGRFRLGVGSGEALNEQITGLRWPPTDERLEMLEEAVEVMRSLWSGKTVNHRGRYYTVDRARLYSCPDDPPPVLISAFGPKALHLAARAGDGFVTTSADADAVGSYRQQGGKGPVVAAMKVCWAPDESEARRLAFETWPTTGIPGELNQELPSPSHFEQAASLVTEEMVTSAIPCGPDPERHVEAIRSYIDAGCDEIYISQIGDDQEGFMKFFTSEVRPRISA